MNDPVQEQLDAYNAHDLPRFLACYAPDVRVEDAEGRTLSTGLEAMRQRYGAMFAAHPDLRATLNARMRAGEFVVDDEEATYGGDSGPLQTMRVLVVYRVRDGLIVHVRFLM
ncbi:MAG TPA: nuclear transport factor 2 family protein [Longimicrobium sp.]|nr:nuclear transport factor 2 family protein [Longimicrobium sp.]